MYNKLQTRVNQLLKVMDILTRRLANSNLQEKNVDNIILCCSIPPEKLKHSIHYDQEVCIDLQYISYYLEILIGKYFRLVKFYIIFIILLKCTILKL